MLCCTIQKVRSYSVKVASVDRKFKMTTKVNKVDKGDLLSVSNPHYEEMIGRNIEVPLEKRKGEVRRRG